MLAKERAEKRLAQAIQQSEKLNRTRAEAALQRAMARLRAAEQARQ
jgi:F-type H+-transporting ATPase subunit epsilon